MKATIFRFLFISILLSAISADFLKGRKNKGMSGGKKSKGSKGKGKGSKGDNYMMFEIDLENEESYDELLTPQTGDPNAQLGRTARYVTTGAIMRDGEVVGAKLLTITTVHIGDDNEPYLFAEGEYFWDGPEGGSISAKVSWKANDEMTMINLGVVGTTGMWSKYKNLRVALEFTDEEEHMKIYWD
mmetsp:Transcript_8756/g.8849  ORF Transcript_8756/g.8849 Transcript_8756/m.8849 type:complete len:186 (-) Transcript_8756:123-680(-)|eukprot:CAMPEP_0182418324 /NCGR_PEP_ID=MMETSP1167-20130531/2788_1 /TAXON_ID=2988 /ORGANISM="Mallomonas Sp, Strain CCMP3275" /LENGTH=185 /DNA_ID=CAMNT_0024592483 /DNA_START=105 /DNA_END=662 /DNA_ORIENTATION=-